VLSKKSGIHNVRLRKCTKDRRQYKFDLIQEEELVEGVSLRRKSPLWFTDWGWYRKLMEKYQEGHWMEQFFCG
jgi:hypothetical protein